jgi:hypothetical protein
LYRENTTDSAFEVHATHGDEFYPPIPLISAGGDGLASTQDDFENGITWSKADQPEHFMADRKFLIGNQASPILRILAAGEALWILKGKGDGIYRLTGFGERTGWTVTQRSADTYLLHPDLAVVHDDKVYAWTNKGMVVITDGGIVTLNTQIANLTSALEQTLAHDSYDEDEMPCAFAVSGAEEVIFGLPGYDFTNDAGAVQDVFVYHVAGKRWSKWFVDADLYSAAAFDPATRLLMFGPIDSSYPHVERPATDSYPNADREFSCTISSISSNTVTISAGSGWTPAVGDLLVQGSDETIITAITSATVFTVLDASDFAAGAATGYEGVDTLLKWLPAVGPGGSLVKRFSSNVVHWDDLFGVYQWDVIVENSNDPGTESTLSYTRDELYREAVNTVRADTRAQFPRAAVYGTQVVQSLSVRQADARFRVSGLTTVWTVASARPSR